MPSRWRTERAVALAALAALAPSLGCHRALELALDLDLPGEPEIPNRPVKIGKAGATPSEPAIPGLKKGAVDLGTAVYPASASTKGAVAFTFNVPPPHRLGYALAADEQRSIDRFYSDFAKSVGYKKQGDKSFQWSPPPGCSADMSCIYRKLIERTRDDVRVLSKKFKARADAVKLNPVQLTDLALSYVQEIPYKVPDDPFGLRPPPLVIAKREGDCDSKALLLYMILNDLGIEAVMLSSKAHAHTMVGVPVPAGGTSFRWKGRKYAFAEVTAKGGAIGWLPPDVSSPNDWTVELSP